MELNKVMSVTYNDIKEMELRELLNSDVSLDEVYDKLPLEVQTILDTFDEDKDAYKECQRIVDELKPLGFEADYGLDGVICSITML